MYALIESGKLRFINGQPQKVKQQWIRRSESYANVIRACDLAIVTTEPLAQTMLQLTAQVYFRTSNQEDPAKTAGSFISVSAASAAINRAR